MFFQSRFQGAEPPSKAHISCSKYISGEKDNYQLHCHFYYEISLMLSGERYYFFNGQRYLVDGCTLFLMPPLVVHGHDNVTEVEDIVLQFSSSLLGALSTIINPEMKLMLTGDKPFVQLNEADRSFEIAQELAKNCSGEKELYKDGKPSDFHKAAITEYNRNSLVFALISALLSEGKAEITNKTGNLSKLDSLNGIINQIISDPQNVPDMETAARMANMSYYNFSRLFKEATNMNYSEYCNAIRAGYAENLLMNSDMSIAQIAEAIGIDTPSYFTRMFKKVVGFSPIEYRRMYKGN